MNENKNNQKLKKDSTRRKQLKINTFTHNLKIYDQICTCWGGNTQKENDKQNYSRSVVKNNEIIAKFHFQYITNCSCRGRNELCCSSIGFLRPFVADWLTHHDLWFPFERIGAIEIVRYHQLALMAVSLDLYFRQHPLCCVFRLIQIPMIF